MDVEIWMDIGCPFCYIGKRRFEQALERFPHADQLNIRYRSFQLDPSAPKDPEYDLYDHLAAKFGISREQAKEMNVQVAAQAREAGLEFRFDQVIPANSLDAHRLIQFADKHGKKIEVVERLFRAYFTEGRHIGKTDTLVEIAEEAGLNREQTLEMLKSDACLDEVERDGQEAGRIGIRAVPFYVFNRRYAITGAQPIEMYVDALNKAWNEKNGATS
jgi:predicted DsbA family dithiol-disulfide isomerase